MQTALQYRYRIGGGRSAVLPLGLSAAGLVALPFLAGLPLPGVSRAPAPAAPPAAVPQRFSQEVFVTNVARGCRWQASSDPRVQIADCGDESESVRVVFSDGQVAEYRVTLRQDPAHAPGTAAAPAVSAQQPSQPGRLLPNSGTPLRVTVTARS